MVRNLSVAAPGLGQLTCLQDGSSIAVDGQVQCRSATAVTSSTAHMHLKFTAVRLPDCTARQCCTLQVGASCRLSLTVHRLCMPHSRSVRQGGADEVYGLSFASICCRACWQSLGQLSQGMLLPPAVSCRGSYTFTQDSFEAGSKVFNASVTAANMTLTGSVVPPITVTVMQTPRLTLVISEDNCTLNFIGECCMAVLSLHPWATARCSTLLCT